MRESAGFDAFYAGTAKRMVGQVYAMVGDLAETEDAVQEAYARAWQRWRKVERYADSEAWVRTVAYRIAVSSWRKSGNRLRAHRRDVTSDEVPGIGPDQLALVAACLVDGLEDRLHGQVPTRKAQDWSKRRAWRSAVVIQ